MYSKRAKAGQPFTGIIPEASSAAIVVRASLANIGWGRRSNRESSSSSNQCLLIQKNEIVDVGTWGVKCANRFRDIVIEENDITRPGCAAITCSAPGDAAGEAPGNVVIRKNKILNAGASGLWAASEPAGVILYARSEAAPNSPWGVTAHDNQITDDQHVHTMFRAFDAVTTAPGGRGPATPWAGRPGVPPNIEYDNTVSGFRVERSRGWG